MRRKEFIDIILNSISNKFDIYHNYWFKDKKFVIYAYCYNHNNKYDSVGESSKLWEAKSFEHLFFINRDNLEKNDFTSLMDFAIHDIEPHFVRGDGKAPMKHHLYSYISFVIITRNKPSKEVEEAIENVHWTKNYKFSMRGYSELRFACVTPREYHVISNNCAKDIKEYLMDSLLHIKYYKTNN